MDFSLILFYILLVLGAIILIYRAIRKRKEKNVLGFEGPVTEPAVLEFARALFPVILIVFVLRSFIVEPFRIPSGSMYSTLHIGDFILVNKFNYGIRVPILNYPLIPIGSPERGDVMVFKYPKDTSLNFIKRVVGLPGDTLKYVNKQLYINGEPVPAVEDGEFTFSEGDMKGRSLRQLVETIDDKSYTVLVNDAVTRTVDMEVTVPPGNYFVMGDNRDHSNDSRYWRFVPEDHIVGRAFFIWMSWKGFGDGGVDFERIGDSID